MGNPVVFFEIGCKDQGRTSDFYSKCFDWEIEQLPNSSQVQTSEDGIHGHITDAVTEIENYITFYIQVDDVQSKLKTIEQLGGKTIVQPINLPNGDTFAWFQDTAGNTVGLISKHESL